MAAKSYDYLRFTMYGTIAGLQTWSCNLSVLPTAVDYDNADISAWLTSLDTAAQAWWNATAGVKVLNSTDVSYRGIRAEAYPAGATTAQATGDHPFSSPLAGTTSVFLPTQCSLVVALQTALGGPHQRGRIYVPAVGASMFSPHVLATSQADAAANSTATLITAINASTFAASAVSVIVAGSISLPGDVIQVKCDNEMDIQRRRADKLVATYSKVTTV